MHKTSTLTISDEAYAMLLALGEENGFTPEMAAEYAVRLVFACLQEGLLEETPLRAWPERAQQEACALRSTGTGGKVLAFPGGHA